MNYTDYQNARDVAWKLLIDQQIKNLPIQMGSLCKALGITVKLYVSADENDGMSFIVDKAPIVLVSREATLPRQRFTVAHELGHILLGHVGKYKLVNREPSPRDNPVEQAANVFASRLLAPACVLWGCNAKTPEQIAALCSISYQAAQFRADRMKALYKRGKFLSSPLERKVYEQFEDYIAENKL